MDVPFFLLLQQQPERPRRSSYCRSGSGPFRRQSHRPTDYYPVTVSPLSPMAIPERLKDVPGTVTRVPARSAGTPTGAPNTIHRTGQMRGPAAQERPSRRSPAYRSRQAADIATVRPLRREVPTSAAGSPLAFWYEALLDGADAAEGVRCNSAARGSFRPWLRPVDSPTGE